MLAFIIDLLDALAPIFVGGLTLAILIILLLSLADRHPARKRNGPRP
jgi:hypothetical protein